MRFQEVGLQRLEKEEGQEEQLYQLRLALEQVGHVSIQAKCTRICS